MGIGYNSPLEKKVVKNLTIGLGTACLCIGGFDAGTEGILIRESAPAMSYRLS
jgi:hypothetical protein